MSTDALAMLYLIGMILFIIAAGATFIYWLGWHWKPDKYKGKE